MESTEAPRAERQRGMWMGSEAEPNSRWQNGHGHMRGRPLIGPPAARGGAGADSSCLGVGGVASQRANAIGGYTTYEFEKGPGHLGQLLVARLGI